MGLREEIAADYQVIFLEVRVDGTLVSDVIGVEISEGLDQINATMQILCASRPSWADEGKQIEVVAGYNGQGVLTAKGELSGLTWSYYPGQVALDTRDKLNRTRKPWGKAKRVYRNQDDAAVIRNLLEAVGIPSSEANIESSGWTLGTIEAVELGEGCAFRVPYELIAEIDKVAGYKTFTQAGAILRRRVTGGVAPSSAFVYTEGVNILEAKRTRTTEGIINKSTWRGLTYEGVEVVGSAQAANQYLDGQMPPQLRPVYVPEEEQSSLIETSPKAQETAQRRVGDLNRRPEGLELLVIGNPLLHPAMTLTCTHSKLETGTAQLLIENVKHSIVHNSFLTRVTTNAGNLSGYNAAAPVPAFDLKLFGQAEEATAGNVSGMYIGIATSTSFDPDGDETTLQHAWTVTAAGGSPTPASGSGPVFRFTLPSSATSVTVELTVTDVDALTGSTTITRTIVAEQIPVEDLWLANGTKAKITIDGGKTWNAQTIPNAALTKCCCPFGADWGNLFGTTDGYVYGSFDYLASALVSFGRPFASATEITAVWVHELSTTRLWAANALGQVAFGDLNLEAKTVAWTVRGSIGEGPVYRIRESYGQFNTLSAMAGNGRHLSNDGGTSWSETATGDVAREDGGGFGENLFSFLNDPNPLRQEDGTAITLPALTPAVTHIRAHSPGWRTQEWYAADDQARLFLAPSPFTAFTHEASAPSGVNHMIRSGNIDREVYLAMDGGAGKWLPGVKAPWFFHRTSEPVYMLGYGSVHEPQRYPVQVKGGAILLPSLATGADDKILRLYDDGTWQEITPPRPEWHWQFLYANPANQQEWIAGGAPYTAFAGIYGVATTSGGKVDAATSAFTPSGYSPLWYTNDGGATWSEIIINLPAGGFTNTRLYSQESYFGWSDDGSSTWVFLAQTGSFGDDTYLWRGDHGTATISAFKGDANIHMIGTGLGGEFVSTLISTGAMVRIDTSLNVTATEGGTYSRSGTNLERLPGNSPTIITARIDDLLWIKDDYRSSTPQRSSIPISEELIMGAASHGVYGVSHTGGGTGGIIEKISNITTTPVKTLAHPTYSGHYLRVGRRNRVLVAVKDPASHRVLLSTDGTNWTPFPIPGLQTRKLMRFIEAIESSDTPGSSNPLPIGEEPPTSTPAPVPAPTATVKVTPLFAQFHSQSVFQFNAVVEGLSDQSVTWSIGGENIGTISSSGLFTASTVAPLTSYLGTVIATSVADPRISGSCNVESVFLTNFTPGITPVIVTPSRVKLRVGESLKMTTNYGDTGVTWSVYDGGGTITNTGLYTAPATPTKASIKVVANGTTVTYLLIEVVA